MAAVYKTLSATGKEEKTGEKVKNKQRVLILVSRFDCSRNFWGMGG